ncbi:MAG TPA: tetratricopeptide repeat-containing sensor histidine kinase [Dinghuibacter sp.]|uniref:tetratricopeptide repeat-containing sensor histidine kinase n=1 Tax=Dinghuibacter sp. TaxID=2024697 RepID=UPI002B6EAAAD|nr:tetratricopeptide repeat-containing sensor histidine kinase [Dinghuibacter sp.]HTJ14639.1 tetratricopeptide repeat-containing sensor histidine kinase [Dinghuibacter sp.]
MKALLPLAFLFMQITEAQTPDSVRLRQIVNRCRTVINTNPDSALVYGQQGLTLAQQLHDDPSTGLLLGALGRAYLVKGDLVKARGFINRYYELAQKDNDAKALERSLVFLSAVDQQQSNVPASFDDLYKALAVAARIDDTAFMEMGFTNIAVMFFNQENYPKTREFAQKALDVGVSLHSVDHFFSVTKIYETLGAMYYKEDSLPQAAAEYKKALQLYQDNHYPMGVATMYTQLSNTTPYDFAATLDYAFKAKAIWDTLAPNNMYAVMNLGNIGIAYARMAHRGSKESLPKADTFLSRAAAAATEENRIGFLDSLAWVKSMEGDYRNAYARLRQRNDVYDSFYSQENKNKVAAIDEKYQVELRDRQIEAEQQALAAQRRQRWFLVGGLVLLGVIGLLLWRQSILRERNNRLLAEANENKTRFFNILNHDLRAPVARLISFLQLRQMAPERADAAHEARLQENVERLLETMEDLLLWSKGQMQHFQASPTVLSSAELFRGLSEYFGGAASLRFEGEGTVFADEHYLKTIMRNLTNNALKTGADVVWKAGPGWLSVTDNGPGATAEQLKALWDEAAPVGIRSGLGLHVVRDLARAIDCKITVSSAPGAGTTFLLELPAATRA